MTFIHVFNIPLLHTTLSDGHGRDGCGFFFFFLYFTVMFFLFIYFIFIISCQK